MLSLYSYIGDASALCLVCRDIDFKRFLIHPVTHPIHLGTWSRISKSQCCPFCRLVKKGIEAIMDAPVRLPTSEICLINKRSWQLGIELSPYDLTKSETSSNKFDLRSSAIRCPEQAHRLLVYDEQHPQKTACIQYLADHDSPDRRHFFGRRVDAKIDTDLLRLWMDTCEKWHKDKYSDECERNGISAQGPPSDLRLLDVRKMCSVKVRNTDNLSYIALSYVWGTGKMKAEFGMEPAVLNRRDVVPGFTTPLPQPLPQTIKDAMWLARELGFDYLWVDALCIVQDDDPKLKQLPLNKMDAIYNCASLTIAAAAGDRANYGIPGISVPRKVSQYSEVIKGLRFAIMFPSYTSLERSNSLHWNTRGWTFQEKLLSKRIMLFTDQQVYFKCSESIWTEEIAMETKKLSNSLDSRRGKYRWHVDVAADTKELRKKRIQENNSSFRMQAMRLFAPMGKAAGMWEYLGAFREYVAAIQEFTIRELTDSHDKLVALGGVLRTMEPSAGKIFQGLPEKYFLDGLLWLPAIGSIIQRSGSIFPSWSWAGWTVQGSGVAFDVMDLRATYRLFRLHERVEREHKKALKNKASEAEQRAKQEQENGLPEKAPSKQDTSTHWDDACTIFQTAIFTFFTCIAGALLEPDHTAREIAYFEGNTTSRLSFITPTTLIHGMTPKAYGLVFGGANIWTAFAALALKGYKNYKNYKLPILDNPFIVLQIVIVKLTIGACLGSDCTALRDDEVVAFELLDRSGRCVGELTTKPKFVGESKNRRIDLLSISWGLGLKNATNICDATIPRWRSGSGLNPNQIEAMVASFASFTDEGPFQAIRKKTMEVLANHADGKEWSDLLGELSMNGWLNTQANAEEVSLRSVLEPLLAAKEGNQRPRELWTIVNVMSIEWDGVVARRNGIGRVMLDAWVKNKGRVEAVFLA